MNEFTGKVALVTGGSSGIGRATAIKFGEMSELDPVFHCNVSEGQWGKHMLEWTHSFVSK